MALRRISAAVALWALALVLLSALPAHAAQESVRLRNEPHVYDGTRGTEPLVQDTLFLGLELRSGAETPWLLWAHFESELLGRKDQSFDLDRAWVRTGPVTLGRIHPWDVSGNPEAGRPWGLLAQQESQNRGVLLGSGYGKGAAFPQPLLLGWLGAHFWSDPEGKHPVRFGFSATPLFVPNLASEVSLSEDAPASAGRFGRRPPGFVNVNGALLPLRYRIDRSRLVEDVLLQPQLMAQAYADLSSVMKGWETWVSVSRAPSPDPSPDASGFVRINGSDITAVAEVTPKFRQRVMGSLVSRWGIGGGSWRPFARLAAQAVSGGEAGVEFGGGMRYVSLSWMTQRTAPSSLFPSASFASSLLQAEAEAPLLRSGRWRLGLFGGAMKHLGAESVWLRSGTRFEVERGIKAELGVDLFGGGAMDYFGEWRTNDRVYLALELRFGEASP